MRSFTLLLLASSGIAFGAPKVVGDPAHPEMLQEAIAAAYQDGTRELAITPGVYTLQTALALRGLQDLAISAYQVELSIDSSTSGALVLENCHGVAVRGLTLHYASPHTGQAKILAVGSDGEGDYCDVELEPGYPADNGFKISGLVDGNTLLPKADGGAARALKPLGEKGKARLYWNGTPGWKKLADKSRWAAAGDYLVSRGAGGMMCYAKGSDHCTFEDVTIYWGGIFGFYETDGCSANRYIRCTITYGPIPPGGRMRPLASQSADGLHSGGSVVGPEMENCYFEGQMDDGVNIHGSFYQVAKTNGNVLTLGVTADHLAAAREYEPGDRIGIYDLQKKETIERKIISVNHSAFEADHPSRHEKYRNPANPLGYVELTLDNQIDVPFDSVAWFPARCGSGFKITGCVVRNSWSRGLLLKAESGLIRANLIEGCLASGIVVSAEMNWAEAGFSRDLVISENTLRNCSFMCVEALGAQAGAMVITATGMQALGHHDISISNNTFEDIDITNLVVRWAQNVSIENNRFLNPGHHPNFTGAIGKPFGIDSQAVVWIGDCDGVTLKGNYIANLGGYINTGLSVAPTSTNVAGSVEMKAPAR